MHPTIVLVHGAWHTQDFFRSFRDVLEDKGYQSSGVTTPSITDENPLEASVVKDAEFLRQQVLLPLIDEGKEVVLVMHSYGGAYGAVASKDLEKNEREKAGKQGGVIGLIFVTASCVPAGKTTLEMMGLDAANLPPGVSYDENTGRVLVPGAADLLFNNLSPEATEHWMGHLQPQALMALVTPTPYDPFGDPAYKGKCAYIYCGLDHIFPPPLQELYAQAGKIVTTWSLPGSAHEPFLEMPEVLADAVIKLIGELKNAKGVETVVGSDGTGGDATQQAL